MNAAQNINISNVSIDNHIVYKTKRIIIIYNWWWLSLGTYLNKNKSKQKKTSKNHWFGQKRGASKREVSLMY